MSLTAFYLERMNAAHDSRVCEAAERPVLYTSDPETGDDIEIPLPMKWGVCPVCNGEGRHVNPSIDAGGLSAEDFDQDPDFAEAYMAGAYDQVCNRCEGRTTVPVVNEDAIPAEQLKAWRKQERELAECRAQERAEWLRGA